MTVHHQAGGALSVSVDEDDLRLYTPKEFSAICVRIGDLLELEPDVLH